jgi:hypothetical protein
VVAFVAEFSRGKSELINAIFFADAGRRVLPATPGAPPCARWSCSWDPQQPPALALLPIATRLSGLPLADLRKQRRALANVPLPVDDPWRWPRRCRPSPRTQVSAWTRRAAWASGATSTRRQPAAQADGRVEFRPGATRSSTTRTRCCAAAWWCWTRPGLNAIGAEPELTLGLLPRRMRRCSCWRPTPASPVRPGHLARPPGWHRLLERFVVLNKIDALADPLATPPPRCQRRSSAMRERWPSHWAFRVDRVFPVSARQAWPPA